MKFKPKFQFHGQALGKCLGMLVVSGLALQACQAKPESRQASAGILAEEYLGQPNSGQLNLRGQSNVDAPTVAQLACGPGARSKLKQPFACDSIWNMPIGSGAQYVDAGIQIRPESTPGVDEDIIVMEPSAPLMAVYENFKGWSREALEQGQVRCVQEGKKLIEVPIPPDFTVNHEQWTTPNNAAAVLLADGRSLYQTQPFHRCSGYNYATSQFDFGDDQTKARFVDIYGPGISGAHGGSRLSSLGGTIRLGELAPGKQVIPHALKLIIWAKHHIAYRQDGTNGYRWPATAADGYASPETYGGQVPALEMGALLALKPDFDLNQLKTEPGKIIARTLQDYGAYVVDDTAWNFYGLAVERSPQGVVIDDFEQDWGFRWKQKVGEHPWEADMRLMMNALYVVDNNAPNSVGGGGTPRAALAPAIVD